MGKLIDSLDKQLNTEFRKDAEDCLKIYSKLGELSDGHVWSSEWSLLVKTVFKGLPSSERRYKPTAIGYIFLKGI